MSDFMENTTTEELKEQEVSTEAVEDAEQASTEDAFREAVEAEFKKIQRQNLMIGAQTICRTVLDRIIAAEAKPGKRTMNDYKRLIKDLKNFCITGLSRKVNADGETEPVDVESPVEETVQN